MWNPSGRSAKHRQYGCHSRYELCYSSVGGHSIVCYYHSCIYYWQNTLTAVVVAVGDVVYICLHIKQVSVLTYGTQYQRR